MREITAIEIERISKKIYNPAAEIEDEFSGEILRIEQQEDLTRIDFVHHASRTYINGGWVRIEPGTFIRPVGTADQLTLIKAVNIPVAPKRHNYQNSKQSLYYTLYFPGLPPDVTAIDIIEREAARPNNFFNFYGVSLERIAREVIIAPN
jgi:hypothetical protein